MFQDNDPFQDPFHSWFTETLIFYPTYGYHLEKNQYGALLETLKQCGEDRFCISEVEYQGDFFQQGQHWECNCPSYEQYLEIPLVLENAVYSRNGLFGILISHEDHAVITGSKRFVNVLKHQYPDWQRDELKLLQEWKDNSNLKNTGVVKYLMAKFWQMVTW